MKIATKDIDSFLNNIPAPIKSLLIYGPDYGQVTIRKNELKASREIVAEFSYEQIKDNPNIILDKFNSIDLFKPISKKQKLIFIDCQNSSINSAITKLISGNEFQDLVVFFAHELSSDSSLRKFFESNQYTASIACYQDTPIMVTKIAREYLKEKNININHDLISLLVNYLPQGDRLMLLSELEKLSLYLATNAKITADTITNYFKKTKEVTTERLCYLASLRQNNNFDILVEDLIDEGHNLISIIRALIWHFFRLYQTRLLIEQGKSEQQALDLLSPPVFFKQVNDFKNSLNLWTSKNLGLLLKELNFLELSSKKSPNIAAIKLKNIFVKLT